MDWKKECNQLIVQLAGCSAVALGYVDDYAKPGDYGWSPAYQDVLDLRLAYNKLEKDYDYAREFFEHTIGKE